jgi:hypothetical protein
VDPQSLPAKRNDDARNAESRKTAGQGMFLLPMESNDARANDARVSGARREGRRVSRD